MKTGPLIPSWPLAAALSLRIFLAPAEAQRTTPFKLVMPTYGEKDLVVKAWNEGLGRSFDFVGSAPLKENFADLERVKVGTHCWTSPSVEKIRGGAAKAPALIKCVGYDFEHWEHTPKSEQADVVAASQALRALCSERGWKTAISPMYRDGLKLAKDLAPWYDIYIVQCQKAQGNDRRAETVRYLREISDTVHRQNPKCMVGCQLGTLDTYGDGTPGSGLKAAMALYEDTKDFIQIYGAWWPPDGKRLIELLKAMDASPATNKSVQR
jgi:hypothetical protein